MNKKASQAYVRCFWVGRMQLINGTFIPVHCTHISNKFLEVEAPQSIFGSKKVKLELDASHEGRMKKIKAICAADLDVLNEHDKHYIKLHFERIADEDIQFIEEFVEAHT
jgi:hypothetical protein